MNEAIFTLLKQWAPQRHTGGHYDTLVPSPLIVSYDPGYATSLSKHGESLQVKSFFEVEQFYSSMRLISAQFNSKLRAVSECRARHEKN